VASLVREHFYDPQLLGLDWEATHRRYEAKLDGAEDDDGVARVINAMLAELKTSHTGYYTEDDPAYWFLLDLFRERMSLEPRLDRGPPSYVGIGVETVEVEGKVFAQFVVDGGPAAAAGVLRGDRLLTVDGAPWHPVRAFRGKKGRTVELLVQRLADSDSILSLKVIPWSLSPRKLYLEALLGSARIVERRGVRIAYAHVWSYAGDENHHALTNLLVHGPLADAQALVLDLRGGWGGADPEYLDLFAKPRLTMSVTDREGRTSRFPAHWGKPTVLLVDGTTRSGKEVFTLGFQRERYGQVLGSRTAGAVVAGRAFSVGERGLLYLAVADVRVDGERLEGRGVAPDIEVPAPVPYAAGRDPVLERALEVLAEQVRRAG
jgi:carboxyl-terminal processing protease